MRRLARAPGFTITTIASLALAVGANTAIFSIVNALWLRPLPVRAAERIVVPYYPVVHSSDGELLDSVQLPAAQAMDDVSAFEAITYELNGASRLGDWRPVLRLHPGEAPIPSLAVRANYFDVLGVPIEGRAFSAPDDEWGSDPVAIVSRRFWRRQVGERPFEPGVSIRTVNAAIPVVGIAAAGFHGPRLGDTVDLWVTMGALPRLSEMAAEPGITRLTPVAVFARLRPDVSIEAAEAETRAVLHPRTTLRRLRNVAFPLRSEGGLARQRSLVQTLSIAALLTLVLGCANLAALFTARGIARRHELAVHLSLGGSGRHLVAMVVSEAAMLAVAGMAAGLLFRIWLLRGVGALEMSAGVDVATLNTTLDWRVLACGVATAAVALALSATAAVRQASRMSVSQLLGRETGGGTRAHRHMRQVLLATHGALAVALLIAACALVGTVARAFSATDPFARADLIVASVRPRFLQYMGQAGENERRVQDYAGVIARLERLPSLEGVTHGAPPLRPRVAIEPTPVRVDGRTIRIPLLRLEGGPGYLAAIGARLVEGRDFGEADIRESVQPREMMRFIALRRLPRFRESAPKAGRAVTVIDQTFASLLWPEGPAVGRSFVWAPLDITYTVIGVTAPVGRHPRSSDVTPVMVVPQGLDAIDGIQPLRLVMRATGGGRSSVPLVASALRESFPDAPVLEVNTAAGLLEVEMSQERMGARIFSYYAFAALVLAAAGVYGLLLFLVRQSRHEFAVRYALGASERALTGLALARVLGPIAAGAISGVLIAHAFGAAVAARVVGLGTIPVWMSLSAAAGFCLLGLASALMAARALGRFRPADLLKSR